MILRDQGKGHGRVWKKRAVGKYIHIIIKIKCKIQHILNTKKQKKEKEKEKTELITKASSIIDFTLQTQRENFVIYFKNLNFKKKKKEKQRQKEKKKSFEAYRMAHRRKTLSTNVSQPELNFWTPLKH